MDLFHMGAADECALHETIAPKHKHGCGVWDTRLVEPGETACAIPPCPGWEAVVDTVLGLGEIAGTVLDEVEVVVGAADDGLNA